MGPSTLYPNKAAVETSLNRYIKSMEPAVKRYLESLFDVAFTIKFKGYTPIPPQVANDNDPSINTNLPAALTIHGNINGANGGDKVNMGAFTSTPCKFDLASKFAYFFQTAQTATICETTPLFAMMVDFINKNSEGDRANHFRTEYYVGTNDAIDQKNLMTAYNPGKRQGVTGTPPVISNPLNADPTTYSALRNSYSTKFFQLSTMIEKAAEQMVEPALREEQRDIPNDFTGTNPTNFIDPIHLTPGDKKLYWGAF
jgi:hypothetical protein